MVRVRGLRAAAVAVVVRLRARGLRSVASARSAQPRTRSGSTFVVANTSSVQKLDPDVVTNFLDFQALGLIYDTLVQFNAKLQIVARSRDELGVQRTATRRSRFQLRKGVKFDDGTTFTSAERRRLARARRQDPKTADASASFIATVTKIVAGRHLRREARALAPRHLGARRPHLGQPGDALDQGDRGRARSPRQPDGTGPFQFVSWTPEQLVHRRREPELLGRQGRRCRRSRSRRSRASSRSPRRSRPTPSSSGC